MEQEKMDDEVKNFVKMFKIMEFIIIIASVVVMMYLYNQGVIGIVHYIVIVGIMCIIRGIVSSFIPELDESDDDPKTDKS